MLSSRMIGLLAVALCMVPSVAMGVPVGGSVIVPYGGTYSGEQGDPTTHRGVDVVCAPGDSVYTPVEGEVTFVGRIPSAAGGTILAVSVRAGCDVVSLMPLESASVVRGARVQRGEEIGVAAESGDPSCEATHVHLGLRRNGVHIDPAVLLADAPEPCAEPEAVEDVSVIDAAGTPATAPAHHASGAPDAGMSGGPSVVSGPEDARATTPLEANVGAESAGRSAVRDAPSSSASAPQELAPGVALARPSRSAEHDARRHVSSPAPAESLMRLARRAASPESVASLAAAMLAVVLILSRRAVERRFQSNPPVSDRLGNMLQHVRAGDTLCGLTSCSGLLPSQSRGRLAQRR